MWGLEAQIKELREENERLKERARQLEIALDVAISEIPDPSNSLNARLRKLGGEP